MGFGSGIPNGGFGGMSNYCPTGGMCQCFAGQQIGTCPGSGTQCACSTFGTPGVQSGFQPGVQGTQGYAYCPRNSALQSAVSIPLVLGALIQML